MKTFSDQMNLSCTNLHNKFVSSSKNTTLRIPVSEIKGTVVRKTGENMNTKT